MSAKPVTMADVSAMFREAFAETTFFPRTNQTYFPAKWVYGEGADDASTSDHYNTRRARAAEHVIEQLCEEYDLSEPCPSWRWNELGSRDIVREIAAWANNAIVIAITE